MKILLISPNPPNHLNRIRLSNILKALLRDHSVYLVSLHNSQDEQVEIINSSLRLRTTLVSHPKARAYLNCMLRLPLPEPLEAAYCYSPTLGKKLRKLLASQQFDLVYVKRTRMARYGLKLSVPTVLDLTDSMELHYYRTAKTVRWYQKPLYVEEWLKYRFYEQRIVPRYDACVVASSTDKEFIQSRAQSENLYVVPNVVDTDYFRPRPDMVNPFTLVFSGLLHKQVNIDGAGFLLEDIFPIIRQSFPQVRLLIVGPGAPNSITAYVERYPNVQITGYVPDIRDYIARSSVVLVPIRAGAGTRNKILQAMSMEKPIVSTTIGAEGIDGLSPENICIGDSPEEFANHIKNLLQNDRLRQRLGRAGRHLVVERYSINALRHSLELVMRHAIARSRKRIGKG